MQNLLLLGPLERYLKVNYNLYFMLYNCSLILIQQNIKSLFKTFTLTASPSFPQIIYLLIAVVVLCISLFLNLYFSEPPRIAFPQLVEQLLGLFLSPILKHHVSDPYVIMATHWSSPQGCCGYRVLPTYGMLCLCGRPTLEVLMIFIVIM